MIANVKICERFFYFLILSFSYLKPKYPNINPAKIISSKLTKSDPTKVLPILLKIKISLRTVVTLRHVTKINT